MRFRRLERDCWEGTSFLRRLKARYDGVKVLAGYPGGYASILRWAAQSEEWVVGCITNRSRALTVNFDFLPEGDFMAEIYGDTDGGNEITYEQMAVNRHSQLVLSLPEHGGAGIYVARELAPLTLTAEKRYSVRLFYSAAESCELELNDGKTAVRLTLPGNVAAGVYTTGETAMRLGAGRSRLTLKRLTGAVPSVTQVAVIDNDPPGRWYPRGFRPGQGRRAAI